MTGAWIGRVRAAAQKGSNMKRIAIDAFGGDYAPVEPVSGALAALTENRDVTILLFGDEDAIRKQLSGRDYDADRLEIRHASQVIHTEESPVQALREKKDSSLVRGLEAVAAGEAEVLISSGSTGAVLSGATLIVKRIPGIKRPAISVLLPTVTGGKVLLIDTGANVDCKPQYLQQFGMMGSAYCQRVLGMASPQVGLLNNGAEANKGNELTKAAYGLLEAAPVNFVGNCEARYALSGEFDVIVADGFDGNILLKSVEGTAMSMMKLLKENLMANGRSKVGAALAKPAFDSLKKTFSHEDVGGGIFLGVRGGVIKTHGNAKAPAFSSAVTQAMGFIDGKVLESIAEGAAQLQGADKEDDNG